MKRKLISLIIAFSAIIMMNAQAQETQEAPLDTLTRHVSAIRSELDVLKRIKVTGYIQAQYQVADMADSLGILNGITSYAGGNFPRGVDKRFQLRRARVKFQYDSPFNDKGISTSQFVLQFDVSQNGLAIKDVYAKFTDPWSGWFSITAGMQNRPFGFEIQYSSSLRESPERGRMSQIIFPNERDLGAMLTIQGPKASNWNWLSVTGGFFNGTGAASAPNIVNGVASGTSNTSDFDKFKDFIGRVAVSRSTKNEKVKWGLGASMYNGGYRIDTVNIYKSGADSLGVEGFVLDLKKSDNAKATDWLTRKEVKREYVGADAQVSIDWAIGITALRGEYIQGTQPGTSGSSTSTMVAVSSDIYKRNFNGAYFYFLQNIMQSPFQLIVKYDWYDPNTNVAGDDIAKVAGKRSFTDAAGVVTTYTMPKTNATDIKYTTLGLGLAYRWDANVKITAYYDMVTNETTNASTTTAGVTTFNLPGYQKDLHDNVFTLRAQVKF
jgi:hypothetical protein